MATYAVPCFLFPPVSIPDIWDDPELSLQRPLKIALNCRCVLASRERQIAVLCTRAPGAEWR